MVIKLATAALKITWGWQLFLKYWTIKSRLLFFTEGHDCFPPWRFCLHAWAGQISFDFLMFSVFYFTEIKKKCFFFYFQYIICKKITIICFKSIIRYKNCNTLWSVFKNVISLMVLHLITNFDELVVIKNIKNFH